jgi:RNA polymerase sigma-70 factor (ECF subfamily)
LLSESDWVRRLARRLSKDAAEAEDLAQEALSRGLEQGPEAVSLRAWLGGVVRNLARQGHRSIARRKAREASVARDERLPSAAEALERLQLQQGVVRAVLALEEPYRSTVVLRFYDDLAPRAIAKREGVPVATVKTRLARGLAQLRARLDHEHGGDGRSWALVLLPLATGGRGLVPLATGSPGGEHPREARAFGGRAGRDRLPRGAARGEDSAADRGGGERCSDRGARSRAGRRDRCARVGDTRGARSRF